MRTLRRLTSVGVVWLATAAMLFAGVPHAACRCPDGRVKLLCLGLTSDASACCCAGGSCCAAAARSARPARHSCCGGAAGDTPGRTLGTACCVKTTEPPTTPPPPPTNADRADAGIALVTLLSAAPVEPSPGMAGRFAWHATHALAPPDDLVIRLQHFLI